MDSTELITKANTTANSVLDIMKKKWFITILLWAVLLLAVAVLWTGHAPQDVLRDTLIEKLRLSLLDPVVTWLGTAIDAAADTPLIAATTLIVGAFLALASVAAFWRDGRALSRTVEVDIAPNNVMLRFVVLVGYAALGGSLTMMFIALGIAAVAYALGAASSFPYQRLGAFFGSLMFFALFLVVALFAPVALATIGLWNALM